MAPIEAPNELCRTLVSRRCTQLTSLTRTDPATLAKKPKHRSITSASPTPEPEATTPPSPEASQSKTAPALVDFAKKSIDEMTDAELDEEFDRVWGRPNSLLFGNS